MTHPNSTDAPATNKMQKPYEGFPLFALNGERWAKKIRGRLVYFGSVKDGWQAALEKYEREKDALHAGRKPRDVKPGGATVKELCNHFWNAKKALLDNGELSPRTFRDYELTTDLAAQFFGKWRAVADVGPDDFAELRQQLAKTNGPVALGNWIQRFRILFKFAFDQELVSVPIRYGQGFKRPSKKTLRLEKAKKGKKLFSAEEIRRMIGAAPVQLKAMILLGVNCGFGNSDCGTLPLSAVDLEGGWLDYPRPKTGVARRCPLWAETIQALRDAIAHRPEPKSDAAAGLLFVTRYGQPWGKDIADSPVTKETRKLLDKLGINGHRNFYCLRHTFQTIGDEAKDPIATRFIMGHADSSMSATYREDVSDERLQAVVEYVRAWLFKKNVEHEHDREEKTILAFPKKAAN